MLVFMVESMFVSGQAAPTNVVVRPDVDRYVGTGGLLLPGSVDTTTRRELASCRGCRWRLSAPCDADPLGSGPCGSVSRGCPAGRELLRIWFQPQGSPWIDRGVVCIASGEVVTVEQVGAAQREAFERRVPALNPKCWPPAGVVTNIPVICASGQPAGRHQWTDTVAGWRVTTWIAPTWTWTFAPGAVVRTESPGGPYPDFSVSHTYRTTGTFRTEVLTTWSGEFQVDGAGTFALEPLTQRGVRDVEVQQARGLLTTSPE